MESSGMQTTSRRFNKACHIHTRSLQDKIKQWHQIIPDVKLTVIQEETLNLKMFSNAETSLTNSD